MSICLSIFLLLSRACLSQRIAEDVLNRFISQFQDQNRTSSHHAHHIGHLLNVDRFGTIQFSCKRLYASKLTATTSILTNVEQMPKHLEKAYTMGGVIPVQMWYMNEAAPIGVTEHWSKESIEERMKQPNTCGTYEVPICQETVEKFGSQYIKGKRGVVLGSQSPWLEAALLAAGASHMTTIEYAPKSTDHPQMTILTPSNATSLYLEGKLEPFDFVFSFSSIEHDGLGRYGDPLNPYGDLETAAQFHCLLKPDGVLFLGMPVGPDLVTWNAHRIYGKHRLFALLSFWKFISVGGTFYNLDGVPNKREHEQPIFVLQKKLNLQDEDKAIFYKI